MAGNPLTLQNTEVIFVLYAVVALISVGGAVWGFYSYLNQNVPKGQESSVTLIIGIICTVIAIACGGIFLAGRVNKTEEIHVTE